MRGDQAFHSRIGRHSRKRHWSPKLFFSQWHYLWQEVAMLERQLGILWTFLYFSRHVDGCFIRAGEATLVGFIDLERDRGRVKPLLTESRLNLASCHLVGNRGTILLWSIAKVVNTTVYSVPFRCGYINIPLWIQTMYLLIFSRLIYWHWVDRTITYYTGEITMKFLGYITVGNFHE